MLCRALRSAWQRLRTGLVAGATPRPLIPIDPRCVVSAHVLDRRDEAQYLETRPYLLNAHARARWRTSVWAG